MGQRTTIKIANFTLALFPAGTRIGGVIEKSLKSNPRLGNFLDIYDNSEEITVVKQIAYHFLKPQVSY